MRSRDGIPISHDAAVELTPSRVHVEKERLQSKVELKDRKRRAAELEGLIRAEAEQLDSRESPCLDCTDYS